MSDSQNQPNRKKDRGRFGKVMTALICVAILAGAGAVMWIIFNTEPKATRGDSVRKTAMLVETTKAVQGTFQPEIVAMGTVRPAQEVMLNPRVTGMVIEKAENFNPGGFVKKGEVLLRIDPADFENTLKQRESDLRRATADLELEMGRQNVARQGAELLNEELNDESESLVLRQPQLTTVRADVEAAKAMVEQAKLDLDRTEIKAPFDAHVLSREVSVGSQVSPSSTLGRLVGIDEYWIESTVPLSVINRLSFSETGPDTTGSEVEIFNPSAWEAGQERMGSLFQLVGALAEETRLARVLVSVKNPLSRNDPDSPPLIIGTFVETHLKTKEIPDVIRLDRGYVHKGNTVWLMTDGKLEIRNVKVAFSDAKYSYIENGLDPGEIVVTSNLSTVVDGIELRTQNDQEAPAETDDTPKQVKN